MFVCLHHYDYDCQSYYYYYVYDGDYYFDAPKVGQHFRQNVGQNVGQNIGQNVGQNIGQNIGQNVAGQNAGQIVRQSARPKYVGKCAKMYGADKNLLLLEKWVPPVRQYFLAITLACISAGSFGVQFLWART